MKIGYKGTYNFICLNHKFEIGQIYELPKKPILCEYGFHYCVNPVDVLKHYPINHEFCLLEIEDLSNDTVTEEDKSVTNKIRILREIPKEEYYQLMGFIGNELKINFSSGFWEKRRFDDNNNLIYYENRYGGWVQYKYDERKNLIYSEYKNGSWNKREYDERNNCILYEDSYGLWEKYQYNENNQIIKEESGYK